LLNEEKEQWEQRYYELEDEYEKLSEAFYNLSITMDIEETIKAFHNVGEAEKQNNFNPFAYLLHKNSGDASGMMSSLDVPIEWDNKEDDD